MNSKGPKGLQLEVGARTSRLLVSSYHSFSKSSPSSFSSFLFLASCQMIFSIVYCRDLTCIYLRPLIIASQWESRGEAGGSTWEFKLLFQPHEMAAKYHNAFCIHLLFAFSFGPLMQCHNFGSLQCIVMVSVPLKEAHPTQHNLCNKQMQ